MLFLLRILVWWWWYTINIKCRQLLLGRRQTVFPCHPSGPSGHTRPGSVYSALREDSEPRIRTKSYVVSHVRLSQKFIDGRRPRLLVLTGEYLDDAIAASADDPSAVLAPDNVADPLAAHDAMSCDLLRTGALLEAPEP